MHSKNKWILLMAIAAVFLLAMPVHAGYRMVEENGDTTLISKGRLKGMSEANNWILNGPKNEIIFFDVDEKIYSKGTVDEYCSSIKSMIEEMMKGVPAEQRKMMEQMRGKGSPGSQPEVIVEKMGDGGTIAGFKTVKYKVLVDGELFEEVWLTNDSALMKEFKPLIQLLQKFSSCTGDMGMEAAPEKSPEYQKIIEMGFELKSVQYEYGNPEPETDVVELEKTDIPDKEFEIPPEYKQRSFSEMMESHLE